MQNANGSESVLHTVPLYDRACIRKEGIPLKKVQATLLLTPSDERRMHLQVLNFY